ncbi:MAG: carboxypeptidase-like regulatory domain-containing protein [Chitinophagales bacterium]|nr:carboxypeptidase-like regulatory domain-containing protein [Chitinophagales bacterium]MDW8419851.1 carboxypeptidase-like regulatory domain-containing protein [Chitinophagales bacterium]
MTRLPLLLCLLLSYSLALAQAGERKLIQFSGYAMSADSLMGVPFAHITIVNRGLAATAGPDGFFSFAAHEGDTLLFTCIGFKPVVYIIPTNLETDKYSVIQLMTKTEYYLPETLILPWRREDFGTVFIYTKPPEDDLERARRNLEREKLAELGAKLEQDAYEGTNIALRQTSSRYYYYRSTPPQNIFNPLAWAEFIRAWKRGDFMKK